MKVCIYIYLPAVDMDTKPVSTADYRKYTATCCKDIATVLKSRDRYKVKQACKKCFPSRNDLLVSFKN